MTYSETTKELEQAVMWAELRLDNCSWATGDSNRAKVKEAKTNLAEHKATHNDL